MALIEGVDYWHYNRPAHQPIELCYFCDQDADIACFRLNGFKVIQFTRICANCFVYMGVATWRL